ncbi:MAG: hypothetical protein IJ206_07175 [Oscillospiraceae bacterium]|nr:hypothetical protein [Oscillospiraceae bacterium]
MKKILALILAFCLITAVFAGCGNAAESAVPAESSASASAAQEEASASQAEPEETETEWSREGYFQDENEHMLSVIWMDDVGDAGWYVGCMLGEDAAEDSWGGMLPQDGNSLKGVLPSSGSKEDITVTVAEDDADGLILTVEGGETYHFAPMDLPTATIIVTINTEGKGNISYAQGEVTPEIDEEFPFQSAQINLAEPDTYTLLAWTRAGNQFVKWTRNGEDFSTDPQITVSLDESAEFIAVFEEDPDWQNPVMNFVGEYECGQTHAKVDCFESDEAWITIENHDSDEETIQWDITGRLDPETLTIEYSGCTKSVITYDADGDVASQEPEYEDGTGTIVFGDDGTFTWHENQSGSEEDLVFEFAS